MDEARKTRVAENEARRRKRKSRGRGLRRTTGCLICKRRHLRCDEASPECGNCVKSKHSCLYAAPGPPFRLVQDSSHDDDETTHLAPQSPQASTIDEAVQPYQLNPNNGHDNNDNDGNDNTCTHPDPHYPRGPISDVALQPYPAAELISPSPSAATHHSFLQENENISFHPAPTPPDAAFYRWFGLLADDAADAADAADDGVTAVLRSQALIKGLSLETFRERYAIPSVIAPCLSEPPPAEAVSRVSWHGSRPAELSDNEVALLDNFVKRVSLWIDLYDPNRYFSVFVPHLAMRDAGLMTAILALSSRQLSISPNASESERDRRIGLQYYYDTLCYLQQAMSIDAYTTSLELLATALIVSMYEMLDDSGNGWERHLKGVFWIQRSQLIHGETGSLRSAVWWAWLRQDVWAAFRERRKTLSFWKPTKAYAAMDVYEIAARIVWIFAKAVDYCSDEEVAAGEDKVRMRIERADVLLAMLDEWKENLPVEFTPMPGITKATTSDSFQPLWIHPPAFAVSTQLFHSARLLLLLHKPSLGGIRGYAEQQKLMGIAASTICRIAMTLTDPSSSLMSSQCLYIAGLIIQNREERDSVVRLMDECHKQTGWPRQSLSEALREEWAKLDST